MDHHLIEDVALRVRDQLRPGLSPLEAVPLDRLVRDVVIADLTVCASTDELLPPNVWGVTTFEADADRAWIWLNKTAWHEVFTGTPRTRFTLAHELGHVVLHGQQLAELFSRPDPDHHELIEREANRFAAHLLIPDAALKRLSSVKPDALAKRFGVSLRMAGLRFDEWRAT